MSLRSIVSLHALLARACARTSALRRGSAAMATLALAPIGTCGEQTHVRDLGTESASEAAQAVETVLHVPPPRRLTARALVAAPAATLPGPSACPTGMALVSGDYCPEVEQRCLRWVDGGTGPYSNYRCAEFAKPATCKAERRPMRFCMDVDEQGATREDPRPASRVSYDAAKQACSARGARLCTESEFHFACEGEEMRPYPYGWSRDATACNIDRLDLGSFGNLKDLREETGARPRCASPFGVRDLTGNLEEWVTRDRRWQHPRSTLLMGSWWLPGRSTCRQTNSAHDSVYYGPETGYRCCL